MRKILFSAFSLCLISLHALTQGFWIQKANFGGVARNGAAGFSIGTKGYIGCGEDGPTRRTDFWEWNQATDVWTQKADFGGIGRVHTRGFSIGSKGYIGTGMDISNNKYADFWEYDPAGNTWTPKANFGGGQTQSAVAFSIGTKGYIATGDTLYTSSLSKGLWEWDNVTNVWTQKANFAGSYRGNAVGFSIGTKGYVGTGTGPGGHKRDFWEWDQAGNTWTQKADFGGTARYGAVGFSTSTKGYIGTGNDAPSGYNVRNDFWEYDPGSDTWTQLPDVGGVPRVNATGFSIGNKGYIGTGWDNSNVNQLDFWEFDPCSGPWCQKADFGGAAVHYAVAFSIGSKGYVGTGSDGSPRKDFWEWNQANNTWTQKADFGGGFRNVAVGFSIGTKGYIGLGYDGATNKQDFWEWDQTGNTWAPKANFGGSARGNAVGFAIGTKGYVGLGNDIGAGGDKQDWWEWDQATDIWTQKNNFGGAARQMSLAFAMGTKGYVGTGNNYGSGTYKKDFWEYNPVGDTWTQKADFGGTERYGAAGFAIGNKGYIGAGRISNCSGHVNDFWEWDQATDTWTALANIGGAVRYMPVGFSIGSKGYIATGQAAGCASYFNDLWEFTPACVTPTVSISGTNIICNGSSTTLTASGASTFAWSTGATTASVTLGPTTTATYSVTGTNAGGCTNTKTVTITVLPLPCNNTLCPPLTLVISGVNPSCNGTADGTASVVASGGTLPYTYSWSASGATTTVISGLVANTYVIEVWDNLGNYCSGNISINNPASLIVNITPPTPVAKCFGTCDGSATASSTGGTSPYSYSWNTVPVQSTGLATGLCAQAYTVTATDANGCTKAKNVLIGQPPLLVSNGVSTSISCFGANDGTASVAPTGGNPPYTYSWAAGGATISSISGLIPVTYTCYISDTKICTATYITTILEPPLLTVTVTGTNTICSGNSTTLTASGANTYSWNTGATTTAVIISPTTNTNYTVTGTSAGGCTKTATVSVTVNTTPAAPIAGSNSPVCSNTTLNLTSNTVAGATYSWTGPNSFTSTAEDPDVAGVTTAASGNYSVTVNVSGCTGPAGVTSVMVNSTPTVGISGTTTICSGNSTTLTASGANTYSWNTGATTASITVNPTTATSFTTTGISSGCSNTSTVSITVTAPPTASISYTGSPWCTSAGTQTVSLTGTGGGAYSSAPAGLTINSDSGLITPSSSTIGTYTVTYTVSGCSVVNATAVVSISNAPAVSISYSGSSWCKVVGTKTVTLTGPAGGTYTATPGPGGGLGIDAVTGTVNPMTSTAGTYTITYTLPAGGGCPATFAAAVITITAMPTAVISYAGSPWCTAAGTQTVTQSGTAGGTYSSAPAGLTLNPTSGLITPSTSTAGTYTVSYTIAAAGGCPSVSATAVVTITPLPTANISYSGSPWCTSLGTQSVTLTGTAGGTYSATPTGLSLNSSSGTITPATSTAKTYTVTYTIGAAAGCAFVKSSAVVQITALPTATISYAGSPWCSNAGTKAATFSGKTGGTYTASPAGLTINTGTGLITPATSTAGSYTVSYTVVAAGGCPAVTATANVTVNPALSVSVTANNTGCAQPDGTANAVPSGGNPPYTYTWSNGKTTQNITGLTTGTYSVTVKDNSNCSAAASAGIAQSPILTAGFSSTTVCYGNPTCFTDLSTISAGSITGWSWNFGDPSSASNTSVIQNPCHVYAAGTYSASLTVTSNGGCQKTTILPVKVNALTVTVSATSSACGQSTGTASVTVGNGTSPYTYQWTNGSLTAQTDSLSAGVYLVYVIDATGCSTQKAVTVNDAGAPAITLVSVTKPSCNGGTNGAININVTIGAPPYTYLWVNGATTQDITGLTAGPYEVVVKGVNGCESNMSIAVSEPAALSLLTNQTDASCGNPDGSGSVTVTGGTGPYTYAWSNASTKSSATGLTAGNYSVTVTDSKGCTAKATAAINNIGAATVTLDSIVPAGCGSGTGSIYVTVTGGTPPLTYAWSNGATTQDLIGVALGNYNLVVYSANNCKGVVTAHIHPKKPFPPGLCMVTVDSLTGTNQVLFDKDPVANPGFSHYNIYRETSASGVYHFVGTVSASQLSTWTDPSANAKQHAWRYKLAAVDTCGTESELNITGQLHKTMHLSANHGVGNAVNLSWDNYEGFAYSTYVIWRFTTKWDSIDAVAGNPSITYNSYTDLPASFNNLAYMVEVRHPTGCTPTSKNPDPMATTTKGSKSNSDNKVASTGGAVNEFASGAWITVYPNPNAGQFTVQSSKTSIQRIEVYNLYGEKVLSQLANSRSCIVHSDLPDGVYFVNVVSDKQTAVKKIVISR